MAGGGIRVGTSGWVYRHWRGVFYPEKLPASRWLDFYARHFDTVEINNTFYRLPSAAALAARAAEVPPGFVFAVKASRFLTHMKKLKDPDEPLARLLDRAEALGPTLGPLLYQLPPHWRCDAGRLRDFLARLPDGFRHVFEFRDPSWYTDEVFDLLTETGVGFCVHDMRGAESPSRVTGRVVYQRFHGPTARRYAGSYPTAELRRHAERLRPLADAGHEVYAYFNNDFGGHAVANAATLRRLLGVAAPGGAAARHAGAGGR